MSGYKFLQTEKLSLEILSLVIYGSQFLFSAMAQNHLSERELPLLFLLLLVPFPEIVIDKAIFALQVGSSDVAYGLLRMLNVPALKEGFILRLPMVNLEVAKECSGIRSSIALLITVLVAAELGLRSSWTKLLLVIAIIPILVIKNGVRIVTIYLLAAYVNPAFLHGWLHSSGGIVFYLLGLVALIPVGVLLQKRESMDLIHQSPMHVLQLIRNFADEDIRTSEIRHRYRGQLNSDHAYSSRGRCAPKFYESGARAARCRKRGRVQTDPSPHRPALRYQYVPMSSSRNWRCRRQT